MKLLLLTVVLIFFVSCKSPVETITETEYVYVDTLHTIDTLIDTIYLKSLSEVSIEASPDKQKFVSLLVSLPKDLTDTSYLNGSGKMWHIPTIEIFRAVDTVNWELISTVLSYDSSIGSSYNFGTSASLTLQLSDTLQSANTFYYKAQVLDTNSIVTSISSIDSLIVTETIPNNRMYASPSHGGISVDCNNYPFIESAIVLRSVDSVLWTNLDTIRTFYGFANDYMDFPESSKNYYYRVEYIFPWGGRDTLTTSSMVSPVTSEQPFALNGFYQSSKSPPTLTVDWIECSGAESYLVETFRTNGNAPSKVINQERYTGSHFYLNIDAPDSGLYNTRIFALDDNGIIIDSTEWDTCTVKISNTGKKYQHSISTDFIASRSGSLFVKAKVYGVVLKDDNIQAIIRRGTLEQEPEYAKILDTISIDAVYDQIEYYDTTEATEDMYLYHIVLINDSGETVSLVSSTAYNVLDNQSYPAYYLDQ